MKKIKLLPFIGMSALCATAAPIALTSCQSSDQMVNLMTVYNPTIEKAKAFTSEQTLTQLTNWYYTKVKENPTIYEQDFYYAHSLYISYLSQNQYVTMDYARVKISNVRCTFKTIGTDEIPQLSGDIKYSYAGHPGAKIGQEYPELAKYENILFEGDFTFEIKNLPMRLYFYNDEFIPGWASQFIVESVDEGWAIPEAYDNTWSITEDAKVTITDEATIGGIYHKEVHPFFTKVSAKTKAEYISNILGQNPVTKLSINDIATSYYMSNLGEDGK